MTDEQLTRELTGAPAPVTAEQVEATAQAARQYLANARRAYALPAETLQDSLLEQVTRQARQIEELEARIEHLTTAARRVADRLDEWAYKQHQGIRIPGDLMYGEATALRMAVQAKEARR